MTALRHNAKETGLETAMRFYEVHIRQAMAKRLWVGALSDYAESDEGRDDPAIAQYRPPRGGDWWDYAPPTPEAADQAAAELAEMYGRYVSGDDRYPMAELLSKAMKLEMPPDEDFRVLAAFERGVEDDELIEEFGSGVAAFALGEGANWFSDHKRFPDLSIVFECHYDGEDLTWNGRLLPSGGRAASTYLGRDTQKEGRVEDSDKIGRVTIINPNDRAWTRHRYVIALAGDLLLVYADSLDDALDEAVDWAEDHLPGVIADEQVREAYDEAIADGETEEEARETSEEDVTSAGGYGHYINSNDWHVIAEDPTEAQLAEIGHLEPRHVVAGRHPTYAGSRIGHVHVANPRQQVHSAHGYLFRFTGRGNALVLAYGDDEEDAATEALDWVQQRLTSSVTTATGDPDVYELVEIDPSRNTLRTIGAENINPSSARHRAARRRR